MTQEEISPENLKKGMPWNKPKIPEMKKFEKETGRKAIYRGKLTGQFEYWLNQKIKYKNLICSICGGEFDSKYKLNSHLNWHKPGFRAKMLELLNRPEVKAKKLKALKKTLATPESKEKYSKANKGDKNPMFGKHHTEETKKKIGDGNRGKKGSNLGKFGKDSSNWKGDNIGYLAIHLRVRKIKIKPKNCEICGLPEFYENLGRLELSNIRNHQYTDDPDDYQYVHRSCHKKYDMENRND